MSELRVALIGCGQRGRELARAVAGVEELAIRRCIDLDAEAATALSAELGVDDWSVEANDALLRDDIDAVLIATRPDSHANLTIAAAQAGKHSMVEAPLALRSADADRASHAVRAAGTTCSVGFMQRVAPAVRDVKMRIPRPLAITLHATVDPLIDVWQGDAAQGGVLAYVGTHVLDLARHLVVSRPARIQAVGGRFTRRAGLGDTLAATVGFANGAIAQLVIGEIGASERLSGWWGTISDGKSAADMWHGLERARIATTGRPVVEVDERPEGGAADTAMLHSFVAAIGGRRRAIADVEDGAWAVRMADAVYESMGLRRAVDL